MTGESLQKSDDVDIVEQKFRYISVIYNYSDYRFGPADEFKVEIIAGPDSIILDVEQMEWLARTLKSIVEMVKNRERDEYENEEGDIVY